MEACWKGPTTSMLLMLLKCNIITFTSITLTIANNNASLPLICKEIELFWNFVIVSRQLQLHVDNDSFIVSKSHHVSEIS